MTMLSPADIAVRKAEEDAHVAEELEQAHTEHGTAEPVTREEVEALLKGSGSSLGGLQSTAEFMTIYNRFDGVPSRITTDQASQRLRVRFDSSHARAGELVWTTKPPNPPPAPGTLKCPLHLESDEREYLNSLNYRGVTCRKRTMKTEMDREDHFRGKHKKIYLEVERDRERQLEQQRMDLMREQTTAMQAMAKAQGAAPVLEPCPEGCGYEGTPNQLRGHKLGAHKEPATV